MPQLLDKDVKQVGYSWAVDWWAYGCVLFEMLTGRTAFGKPDDPSHGIYIKIIQNKLSLPATLHPDAKRLLKSLLAANISERLTDVEDIKSHAWFRDVDWVAVYQVHAKPVAPAPVTVSLCNLLRPLPLAVGTALDACRLGFFAQLPCLASVPTLQARIALTSLRLASPFIPCLCVLCGACSLCVCPSAVRVPRTCRC
jgi:hypothetical protein